MKSSFLSGRVRHRRSVGKKHDFTYSVFMFYFDIAYIEETFSRVKWISIEKFNLFSFYRKNYLGDKNLPLDQAVREQVKAKLGFNPTGKIFLLTNLSCLGYCVNPISLYFVYKENNVDLEVLLLEVTNTPWGERHLYVLNKPNILKKNIYQYEFKKELHVSPFLTMNYLYKLYLKLDQKQIIVHLDSYQKNKKHFDATLSLESKPKTVTLLWWYPLMTLKVTAGIYWQALRLWLKNVQFYTHPSKVKDRNNGK